MGEMTPLLAGFAAARAQEEDCEKDADLDGRAQCATFAEQLQHG